MLEDLSLISINLITLGNATIGKIAYLIRNTENIFQPILTSNIGVDVKIKKIELKNGIKVRVQFFDASGKERFHSLSANFIKRADGIILMYHITKRDSFDKILTWLKDIKEYKGLDFPVNISQK